MKDEFPFNKFNEKHISNCIPANGTYQYIIVPLISVIISIIMSYYNMNYVKIMFCGKLEAIKLLNLFGFGSSVSDLKWTRLR